MTVWAAARSGMTSCLAREFGRATMRMPKKRKGGPIMAEADTTTTRRGVLAGAAASAAALGGTPAMAQTSARKTFVLVHGAYHGGWCWRRVSDLLEQKGHKVFVVTLTGLGERSHLLTKDTDLDTHIADVVNVIKWEDLKDICLVAHSYGGWPGSGAVEQMLDRISSVIWLDAFKPQDGQRGLEYATGRQALLDAVAKGELSRRPPKAEAYSISQKDYAWIDSKLTPQPNGVSMQPIKLTGAVEKVAKKTYIRAPRYPQPAFDKAYAECKADPSWRTLEITTSGHDVMIDAPEWLAEVLVEVA